ncbi:MAG: hypothetical protein JNL82_32825 [Myxococcales bacterium]|nr:hypothetical protein [Myxococcales bacterium]
MHIARPLFTFTARTLVLAGLLGAAACQAGPLPQAPPIDEDAALLRTYAVPPQQARSLERALASALSTGKDTPPRGTVERLPDGKLVVVAPPGIHEGVAALVAGLDAGAPAPAHTAEIDYWVVVGEAAGESGGVEGSELTPALQAIVRDQGPMRFTTLEKVRVASLIDESASVHGNRLEVGQVVTDVGGRLVADVDLTIDPSADFDPDQRCHRGACKSFRTRVHVNPGQLLVIGQTGLAAPAGAAGRSLFYVVRGRTMTEG